MRLLRQIKLSNLLSFGPNTPPLELEGLNVFIGPNGAGKSNFIEALALMRATAVSPEAVSDIRGVLRQGGGPSEWIWKGARGQPATVELTFDHPGGESPLRHIFGFRGDEPTFRVQDEQVGNFRIERERVENEDPFGTYGARPLRYFYYKFKGVSSTISIREPGKDERNLERTMVKPDRSILNQLRDAESYPEITYLAESYEKWRIYRDWAFGQNNACRRPQRTDMRSDRLEEDVSNLGVFLSSLKETPKAKRAILDGLRNLYEGLSDYETTIKEGNVWIRLYEGDFSIPATRLSDGTLRYLWLLAILCDPEPPPLICIEEPELGLHPDILPKLADRLIAASDRTQLIVTTHSDILVDALTDRPEAVVVCEKHNGQTEMQRLKEDELRAWLDKYRLGQLWIDGQLGGKRW